MVTKKLGFTPSKGFTLIELLVVIAIIAVLASIALLGLVPAQKAGRDARRIADLRQVQSVLQLYYNTNSRYPGAPDNNNNATGCTNADTQTLSWTNLKSKLGVTAQFPADPISGKTYYYGTSAGCAGYTLGAILETTNNVLDNDEDGSAVNGLNCADPMYCITF